MKIYNRYAISLKYFKEKEPLIYHVIPNRMKEFLICLQHGNVFWGDSEQKNHGFWTDINKVKDINFEGIPMKESKNNEESENNRE